MMCKNTAEKSAKMKFFTDFNVKNQFFQFFVRNF